MYFGKSQFALQKMGIFGTKEEDECSFFAVQGVVNSNFQQGMPGKVVKEAKSLLYDYFTEQKKKLK